jgi:hypothetical protein
MYREILVILASDAQLFLAELQCGAKGIGRRFQHLLHAAILAMVMKSCCLCILNGHCCNEITQL